MPVSPPPQKKPEEKKAAIQEKRIQEVINKGGKPTMSAELTEEAIKNFNIKLLQSTLETINDLREKRPRPVGQKSPGISLNAWILEAIEEKIKRERKE